MRSVNVFSVDERPRNFDAPTVRVKTCRDVGTRYVSVCDRAVKVSVCDKSRRSCGGNGDFLNIVSCRSGRIFALINLFKFKLGNVKFACCFKVAYHRVVFTRLRSRRFDVAKREDKLDFVNAVVGRLEKEAGLYPSAVDVVRRGGGSEKDQ